LCIGFYPCPEKDAKLDECGSYVGEKLINETF